MGLNHTISQFCVQCLGGSQNQPWVEIREGLWNVYDWGVGGWGWVGALVTIVSMVCLVLTSVGPFWLLEVSMTGEWGYHRYGVWGWAGTTNLCGSAPDRHPEVLREGVHHLHHAVGVPEVAQPGPIRAELWIRRKKGKNVNPPKNYQKYKCVKIVVFGTIERKPAIKYFNKILY